MWIGGVAYTKGRMNDYWLLKWWRRSAGISRVDRLRNVKIKEE
jgi:hypothetical protein